MRKHPFIQNLTNTVSPIIQKYYHIDKVKGNSETKYTSKENYIVESLLSIGEVESVFQQLEQSPYFLTNFRSTKSLKEKGITRFDHIIYHIEAHLFRSTGILDRILILVNIILKLGLSPESCKSHNLLVSKKKEGKYSSQIKERDGDLYIFLIDLMELVDSYRLIRNEITHQKRYHSEDLRHIEMYNILQSSPIIDDEFNINHYAVFVKNRFDKSVEIYKIQMLEFNQNVQNILDKIYERLEFIWNIEYVK